jgi:hypothetical protein
MLARENPALADMFIPLVVNSSGGVPEKVSLTQRQMSRLRNPAVTFFLSTVAKAASKIVLSEFVLRGLSAEENS